MAETKTKYARRMAFQCANNYYKYLNTGYKKYLFKALDYYKRIKDTPRADIIASACRAYDLNMQDLLVDIDENMSKC